MTHGLLLTHWELVGFSDPQRYIPKWLQFRIILFVGYFRVNYDSVNWDLIKALLKENFTNVNVLTRTTLIDDAFNLARFGYLNYSVVFELVNCWKDQETKYFPWKILLDNIEYIYQHSTDLAAFRDIKVRPILSKVIINSQHYIGTTFFLLIVPCCEKNGSNFCLYLFPGLHNKPHHANVPASCPIAR